MGINRTARFLQDCLNKRQAGAGTGSYKTSHLLIEKCAAVIENKVAASSPAAMPQIEWTGRKLLFSL